MDRTLKILIFQKTADDLELQSSLPLADEDEMVVPVYLPMLEAA